MLGALAAVFLLARIEGPIGPFDASVRVTPSWSGDTVVGLAPLGRLSLDTHDGLLRLDGRVEQLRVEEARRFASDPSSLAAIEGDVTADARALVRRLVLRGAVAALVGAAALAFVRRPNGRAALTGAASGLCVVLVSLSIAAVSWQPGAVAEPRYTGLLAYAPKAVGEAREISQRFNEYRAQLTRLVANLTALYQTAQNLPTFAADKTTMRVLHVSDIHLNPGAFDVIRQVVSQFEVDAIVDSGDLTDFGTDAEDFIVEQIGQLSVPYVWVRGNHDSEGTQAAVAAQRNAVVLDGRVREVAGLRFWGVGDPRFTPDKSNRVDKPEERAQADQFAPAVAARLIANASAPVDVVVVHDPRIAAGVGDLTPLVLAGHTHRLRRSSMGGTVVLTAGTTGGAGLRGLQGQRPEPISCSVLYFDAATRRLVAYDSITVAGLGETAVSIRRHVLAPPEEDAAGA